MKHIIFDMDNTLYNPSCGLMKQLDINISLFIKDFLKLSLEEAEIERKKGFANYGTTLAWLKAEHGYTDNEKFLESVHPKDVSPFLRKDPALKSMIKNLPYKSSVLTNGPTGHMKRVLKALDLEDCFEVCIDIQAMGLIGKPNPSAYQTILSALKIEAKDAVLVDDTLSYVEGFIKIGGHGLLLDRERKFPDYKGDTIYDLNDLIEYLKKFK